MRIPVSRAPGAERVVSPLELFFDLVYVFAIGQLSHHLFEHVDLRTGAETLVMALAVIYAWYMTAWGANWLDADERPVQALLVGLMFASLLMSAAIGDAFDERAWLFVIGAPLAARPRSADGRRPHRDRGRAPRRALPPLLHHRAGRDRAGDRQLVRWAPLRLRALVALMIGFTGAVALWWCYFERNEGIGIDITESADDAGAVGWLGTWTLTLIVLALIAIAVGDELAIAHPGDDPTLEFSILTFGGPALFLLAQLFFLRSAVGRLARDWLDS
jgi:low temperature requirement protein LtrA